MNRNWSMKISRKQLQMIFCRLFPLKGWGRQLLVYKCCISQLDSLNWQLVNYTGGQKWLEPRHRKLTNKHTKQTYKAYKMVFIIILRCTIKHASFWLMFIPKYEAPWIHSFRAILDTMWCVVLHCIVFYLEMLALRGAIKKKLFFTFSQNIARGTTDPGY